MKTYIYFHICCINNYIEIVTKILKLVKKSGLYDIVDEIRVGLLGKYNDMDILLSDPKIVIRAHSDNYSIYERITLEALYIDAIHSTEPFRVLYLHSKGVRHYQKDTMPYVLDWVNYLLYFNVTRFKDCLEALQNADTVSVNFITIPEPHYSGNFWWSNSTWICTLDPIIGPGYCDPEFWLTRHKGNFISLWNSHGHHYDQFYPSSCYEKPLRVAICYWGMTRCLRKYAETHHNHVFDVFRRAGIEFKLFMHTWKTDIHRIWWFSYDNEKYPIDYDEHTLLPLENYQIDDQRAFLDTLHFPDYFSQELYDQHGGDTHHEWHADLIRNHLCALESMNRVTQKVLNSVSNDTGIPNSGQDPSWNPDFVVYLRPDIKINKDFPVDVFDLIGPTEIAVPNNNNHEGYNDRFAIVPFKGAQSYGCRIREIKEFRKERGRIVSEKFVKYITDKYMTKVHLVDFDFDIKRPDE